jgi:hypothetical protein
VDLPAEDFGVEKIRPGFLLLNQQIAIPIVCRKTIFDTPCAARDDRANSFFG